MIKLKTTILASVISLSLSACVATEANQSAAKTESAQAVPAVITTKVAPDVKANQQDTKITLEQIMADPDWIGRQAESWYWGDNNHTIFYSQKQQGNNLRDLFQLNTDKAGNGEKVALANMHKVADRFASRNLDNTKEVYVFQGNVYVKTLATGDVIQLTHTSQKASQAMFLTNGDVAFRQGNSFYQLNAKTGALIELANLQLTDKPSDSGNKTFIAQEQTKLIQFIAKKQHQAQLNKQQADALLKANKTLTNNTYYLGKNKQIRDASLSPAGDKLIVAITDKTKRNPADIMPNYVTESGHVVAEPARRRVADNRQYNEELIYIDLTSNKMNTLAYNSLPGFDDDVLKAVREENYKAQGKVYKSKKQPRNIYLTYNVAPITWSKDGSQVAIMLEAWDNKDRWIATLDWNLKQLKAQHRLHDDAWINWNFNDYGWVNNNTLYYASEQSGYSHLYVKPLNGKAKQLTHGKFEVSYISLTPDAKSFVFKANKKHPGIYEIYRVNVDGSNFTALTDLGGMNDYSLSPDGSKLLLEHSTVTMPPELYLQDAKPNAKAKRLTYTVSDKFLSMPWTAPSVVAVPSTHQSQPIYSKVYLPKNYSENGDKYRAVMFSHGAGYLQNSHLGWSGYFREFMFHSMLAQQGYVVIDMDYRASEGYGRDWRTAIYRHMGKPEVEDMRDGVNWLVKNANVDRNRIGTYGGSYGGFLTLMSMFTAPDLFQSGSALRLVSDWAYYNHGYTSNILNTPADDPIAYRRSSPIYFAEGLQKPLLINAPMVDSNVFFEDTVRLTQRLIELEKENVETAIYPVENHGFKQPSSWLYEYRKIYKLFENTL